MTYELAFLFSVSVKIFIVDNTINVNDPPNKPCIFHQTFFCILIYYKKREKDSYSLKQSLLFLTNL